MAARPPGRRTMAIARPPLCSTRAIVWPVVRRGRLCRLQAGDELTTRTRARTHPSSHIWHTPDRGGRGARAGTPAAPMSHSAPLMTSSRPL
eukprot:5104302-Prymnesium_polylepis.1